MMMMMGLTREIYNYGTYVSQRLVYFLDQRAKGLRIYMYLLYVQYVFYVDIVYLCA